MTPLARWSVPAGLFALPLVLAAMLAAPPAALAGEDEWFEGPASAAIHLKPAQAPHPAAVQRALDAARRECLEAGGTGLVARPGFVRTGDLTGDGRPDHVVDFREATCTERATLFSGTGGWNLAIFVARRTGGPVRVFEGRALDYDLVGPGRRTVRFHLHGSRCGRVGADACVKRRRLDARPFTFRDSG